MFLKDNVQIRQAQIQDLPYLYEICLKTAAEGGDGTDLYLDPYVVGQYYVAPYLFYEREFCFVVTKNGIPSGYIVATKNTQQYDQWLEEKWLPVLREQFSSGNGFIPKTPIEKGIISRIHLNHGIKEYPSYSKQYPAHLHIDLLPSLQGFGCGRKLMEKLFSTLADNGVPGVHLGVGKGNSNAQGFYKKIGFSVLDEQEWGFNLGYKLDAYNL